MAKPIAVTIRSYQVGFGDCFLLSFDYGEGAKARHVLVDFGSTGSPERPKVNPKAIAEDIARICEGKLQAVIATHRHADHISGFGGASGKILAGLDPDVILQPWTEDPKAATDAKAPTVPGAASRNAFTASLESMHGIAAQALAATSNLGATKTLQQQLGFLGEANLKNAAAVKTLMGMKGKHVYAHYGSRSGLEAVLPGVKVHVLGPPTLEQSKAIRKMRATDPDEFWQLHSQFWRIQSTALEGPQATRPPFRRMPQIKEGTLPFETRWFLPRLQVARAEQLLELVRILDDAMNNTSLILLFEVGRKKLLFPGDAQIENWLYALDGAKDSAGVRKMLADVDVYKVGHHGSLNATPKTLWKLFAKKGKSKRLRSFVSTMAGKHGSEDRGTEVPRKTLMAALDKDTTLFTTQKLRASKPLCLESRLLL